MNLFDTESFSTIIQKGAIEWNRHALERMMERGISRRDVMDVLLDGEIIEHYPSDYPFPSVLMFGKPDMTPLHVVVACDNDRETLYIITAYYPDDVHFLGDHKTRRT